MPSLLKARAIRPGDRIAIVAPAGPIDESRLSAGQKLISEMGFEPVFRPDVLARSGYLAGEDDRRAAELTQWVTDPNVAALWCARGGYGSSRLISRLDPVQFRAARKPLVGYSDITTLLLWQRRQAGLMGIHGPMFDLAAQPKEENAEGLAQALRGTSPRPPTWKGRGLCGGHGVGRLTGGSLSLSVASLGTPWEIQTRGAILMLEDVTEPPYRIDRMLEQLRSAGKFDRVAGIGLGGMTDCVDTRYPDRDIEAVLADFFRPLGVPVVLDLPFGHGDQNRAWPHGGRASINGDRGELDLLESAVSNR
ncbi:LD-carboxypeptidase [Myxococcota bacterium]|nr:LD-carboxypeptidase [Myxococcota bacterium]